MFAALMLMIVLVALALFAQRLADVNARSGGQAIMIEKINDLLPQTQCGRCTFSGCRPYATALAQGAADINQCPPGGDATAAALAALLRREAKPVDPHYGIILQEPRTAWIQESACIGCTKCIQACPVDAIVGASRYMHTVIAADCTGCELCIPPCPVDCIEMRPIHSTATIAHALPASPIALAG